MKGHKIEVQKRELSNKKSFVKELRKQDNIPGIYYSHDSKESIPFTIDKKILHEALKADTQVYKITVGGKDRDVIIKSVQYHPVSDKMVHIDLYGVNMKKAVIVRVPLNMVGDAIGIKEEGGILNQTAQEIELKCLPMDIPNSIDVNIEDLSIGDTILANQVNLDESLELISDEEMLIVSVTVPMKEVEPEVEEALEEGEEGEEGEGAEGEGTEGEEKAAPDDAEKDADSNDGEKS